MTNSQLSGKIDGMSTIVDAVREAVSNADVSRYRISRDTGVDQGQLSRFVNGHDGVSFETAERLLDYLGLELVIRRKRDGRRTR